VSTQAQPRPSFRILIVDDDPILGDLFLDLLEMAGHQCRVAKTGRDALTLVARHPFDLIISDLRMPEMSGRELWERLQQTDARLAETMIFVSAEEPAAETCRFLQETKHAYLRKPFNIQELLRLVEQAASPPVG
jgi:CheY-like chemotaxis protein